MVDAGGVGDVVETFPVASDTIKCIAAVPEFNEQDPEVLASECSELVFALSAGPFGCKTISVTLPLYKVPKGDVYDHPLQYISNAFAL